MGLKAALACSAALHAALLSLGPLGVLIPPRNPMHPLEVSYVMLEPVLPGAQVAASPKRAEPTPVSRPAAPQKPPSAAPQPKQPEPARSEPRKPEPPASRPPASKSRPAAVPVPEPASPASLPLQLGQQTVLLPEREFSAIRHKELVREHLRKGLRYPESTLQGVVRLKVILLPDGSLKEAAVSEASDPALAAIALRDARSAGPYPRFPKEMGSSEAEYEFLVQYRPGDSSL